MIHTPNQVGELCIRSLEQGPEPPSFPWLFLLLCAGPVASTLLGPFNSGLWSLRQGRDSAVTGVAAILILNLFLDKLIP